MNVITSTIKLSSSHHPPLVVLLLFVTGKIITLLDSPVEKEARLYQYRPQPVGSTNTKTLLVYIFLNGKRDLTGCGLHGCSLVSVLF